MWAAGAAGVLVLGGAAWWLLVPGKLGLTSCRVVLQAGELEVDDKRAAAKQVVMPGSRLHTGGGGSGCLSVHASRFCLGGTGEAKLVDVGEHTSHLEVTHGTALVSASGDELVLALPGGALVDVTSGVVAIENVGGADPDVHVIEGSATLTAGGRPPAPMATGACLGLTDGKARATTMAVDAEQRGVLAVAGEWQGSAGAIVEVPGVHPRVEVDDHSIGRAPLTALVVEGHRTVVVHDGPRDAKMKSFDLKGGQRGVFAD